LSEKELKALLRNSYDLVFERLPKKLKTEFDEKKSKSSKAFRKRR